MDCITCGHSAGYNRAIIDVLSGIELGGFCIRCEQAEFGNSLERAHWSDTECALCNRDGHYALPKWEPQATELNGDLICSVDYEVTDATIRLCDEHLHEIGNYIEELEPWKRTTTDSI